MAGNAQMMRDHWWWRPGWRVGRSFYTWHVTFDDQLAAHQLAADYAPIFEGLPTLDPIPVRWLYLTMQGIGFTDEVHRADVDAIADSARDRCRALAPFTITLGPAQVDPEALMLPVRPTEPVRPIARHDPRRHRGRLGPRQCTRGPRQLPPARLACILQHGWPCRTDFPAADGAADHLG